jgi:hypothetical protein
MESDVGGQLRHLWVLDLGGWVRLEEIWELFADGLDEFIEDDKVGCRTIDLELVVAKWDEVGVDREFVVVG